MTTPVALHPGHRAAIEALAHHRQCNPQHILDTALRHGLTAMAYHAALGRTQQDAERWVANHERQARPAS